MNNEPITLKQKAEILTDCVGVPDSAVNAANETIRELWDKEVWLYTRSEAATMIEFIRQNKNEC